MITIHPGRLSVLVLAVILAAGGWAAAQPAAPALLQPTNDASVQVPLTIAWSATLDPSEISGGYNWLERRRRRLDIYDSDRRLGEFFNAPQGGPDHFGVAVHDEHATHHEDVVAGARQQRIRIARCLVFGATRRGQELTCETTGTITACPTADQSP